MPSLWQSFIPYHVTQDLMRHPRAHPVGREQRFEAVLLFADISGFTAISEALAAVGKRGAEELTTLLNRYFEPMIQLIQSYGGIIGKFGGDAMTVLFPYTADTQATVARRAIQCALDMQARMSNYAAISTQAGVFGLSMKAGLACGPLFCNVVGDPAIRLEYLIAGGALDRCAEAEHCANKGEVVVHDELLAIAGEVETDKEIGCFQRVKRLKSWVGRAPLPPLGDLSPKVVQIIAAFTHPSIAQRLQAEQIGFLNEHRKVTILFAGFEGFDYDYDPQVGEKLQAYLSQVIRIIHRYDGYLNKVDMGDKGSKFIALFGAPIAHENDAERALHCALELRALENVPSRIGVHTGFVFCGQVGSAERQEYTVMGDAVNLSARLMQAAQRGQILVSDTTHSEGFKPFDWETRTSLQMKGKTEAVGARPLSGLRRRGTMYLREPKYTLPMVGRQAELEIIAGRLEQALRGQGQIVGITAEAGLGKSRLTAEIIKLATAQGLTGYGSECISYGTNTPYLVWQHLLRGFFGLEAAWSLEERVKHLQAELTAIDPLLVQRTPLLGVALNLPIPENNLTRPMDARLRKESLEGLLVACIRQRAAHIPLLLVLEDCHWIDALSHDLLEVVARNIADLPLLMVVVYRPPESEAAQLRISRFGHFTEIRLTEFSPQEAVQLIEQKLGYLFGQAAQLPAGFIARIRARAQGNPFYMDEMINLIHDRGLDPADVRAMETFDLPDSLHSLILSRIDQLTEAAKTTLRVASTIGRSFRASWLWGVYPKLGAPERVREQLAQLSRLEITPLDKPEPELEYIFKHIVTREVAYESLSLATRAMLHELIGQYIERIFPDAVRSYLDLLAFHYSLSPNTEKQREYYRKAGDAAQAAYANHSAIEYYQHLLRLLPETEQSEVMLELGKVWRLVGQWREASAIFHRALEIAGRMNDWRSQVRGQLAIGMLLRSRGVYHEALEWFGRAQAGFTALNDEAAVGEVLREIGIVHWNQSSFGDALTCLEHARQIAERLDDRWNLYKAIANQGLVYWSQGDPWRALSCCEEAYQIATELTERLWASTIVGNMGNIYLELGNYPRAFECYAQNLLIALELGYRQGVSIAIGNLGNVYWWQGDYATVLACQGYNLQVSLELGDQLGVSLALWYMANAYLSQKDYADAQQMLTPAIALGRALGVPYELSDYLYSQAELHVQRKEYTSAQEANIEALNLANQVDNHEVRFKGALLTLRLKGLQSPQERRAAAARLEELLADWPDEKEQAALHYEIWRLIPEAESHCRAAAERYRTLYAQTPNVEYKTRYETLTGERLSSPPTLPSLPEIVTRQAVDLNSLLVQVKALVKEAAR